MQPGDVFVTNDPFRGGSHLPDITVVTPVFSAAGEILFLPPIGPITPRSAAWRRVRCRRCRERWRMKVCSFAIFVYSPPANRGGEALRELLGSGVHPSRAVEENLADLAGRSPPIAKAPGD